MPRYCFVCEYCGKQTTVVRTIAKRNDPLPLTECGFGTHGPGDCVMVRDFTAEHSSVRGDYQEPIISDSLAFDAIDLVEHRRRFPNVEVQVDHARSARPIFRNLSQKRAYLKGRKCVDVNSFI